MAEFKEAYKNIIKAEFSNRPELFLHINKHEDGYTLGGIYQKYNPKAIEWTFIDRVVKMCQGNIKDASRLLYFDKELHIEIYKAFEHKYWLKYKLDRIVSQHIANEIIMALVNFGSKAIVYAQQIVGVKDDGIIGSKTINALNNYDVSKFNKQFDLKEIGHYHKIVKSNPDMAINLNGWINRSHQV